MHAGNVNGLGAVHVIRSLAMAFEQKKTEFDYLAPPEPSWIDGLGINDRRIKRIKYFPPKQIARMAECLFSAGKYKKYSAMFVLGDLPLRGFKNQIVFVHQSHLVSPDVNPSGSRNIIFQAMRMFFSFFAKDVLFFIVQSDVMREQLALSYPAIEKKIVVIPLPPPHWISRGVPHSYNKLDKGLKLFYPAAGYPHKNHALFMSEPDHSPFFTHIKNLIITLDTAENKLLPISKKIINVGRVTSEQCVQFYSEADALFFPSISESYGLPLVEAMVMGLPVICADLPYAHWMCGDKAVYFDPKSIKSAGMAIEKVKNRLLAGWRPKWDKALAKLPSNWGDVAERFIELASARD